MTADPAPVPPRMPAQDAGESTVGPLPTLTIRCREDGPLVIDVPAGGGCAFRVVDHRGVAFPLPTHKKAVALCRCGGSGTRPFCDGSHREGGFHREGAFRAAELAPASGSG